MKLIVLVFMLLLLAVPVSSLLLLGGSQKVQGPECQGKTEPLLEVSYVLLFLSAAGKLEHYKTATKSRAVQVDLCTALRLVQLLLKHVNILLHVKKCSFEVINKTITKSQCVSHYVSKALPLPSLTNVTQAVLKLPAGYTILGSPSFLYSLEKPHCPLCSVTESLLQCLGCH